MELSWIGLVLIVFAWAVQIYFMSNNKKEIHPLFAVFQISGILLLVINSLSSDLIIALLNLLTLIGAGIVLFLSLKK
ncbi:hypothetical protein [Methanobacterium alcaliphilum]|uniref:hypothetical protein n=1 Tax=Methanobacterium alcaliphilum TaxID=392018 RepID=UPI00200AC20A|nr:hypothetical protein [Methanobacterium alcaliphilum]MCK9151438.1 hypothetical protein [Methanobacterium alcaliphilum]